MRTSRRLTTAAAVVLSAGAAASPALAAPHQDLRMPDTRDIAEGRVPATPARPVVVRIERGADTGLSWDSAIIGAIAGAGLLVSASGGVLLVTRRHPGTR
jgi:hypothetical protein